ncbi:hypothetical protein SLE2022_359650 [Rubroshorea leprosula]
MLSSTGVEEESTILNRVPSSLSSKSSSSSSSSSPSPLMPKTMEEVWKDINLASLHDHSTNPRLQTIPHNSNFILQDFFARPFTKDQPSSTHRESNLYGTPVPPPPATALSLNSGPGFDFLENSRIQSNAISNLSVFNCPFEAMASSASLASFGKKRVQESDNNSGDRRHKRMMKNRESAARSRARKQEMHLFPFLKRTPILLHILILKSLQQLREENARLKRQHEQLRVAATAQLSKKPTLQRTSTAPF